MRQALFFVVLTAGLSGCGIRPVNAELYALVIGFVRAPASCYGSGMQPATGVTSSTPKILKVQVWDGPDGAAFLELVEGAVNVDMGDAPSVAFDSVLGGTKGSTGWAFTGQRTSVASAGGATFTSTTSATLTFWRDTTFKGAASLSSSRTCTGTTCPAMTPSCTIADVPLSGTRLAVDWEQAP